MRFRNNKKYPDFFFFKILRATLFKIKFQNLKDTRFNFLCQGRGRGRYNSPPREGRDRGGRRDDRDRDRGRGDRDDRKREDRGSSNRSRDSRSSRRDRSRSGQRDR